MLSSFSDFSGTNNVHEVAKLYHSTRLRNVLDKIEHFSNLVRKTDDIQGPVEADPEYILVRRPLPPSSPFLYCSHRCAQSQLLGQGNPLPHHYFWVVLCILTQTGVYHHLGVASKRW